MNTNYQRTRRQRLRIQHQRVFFSAELHPKARETLHYVAQRRGQTLRSTLESIIFEAANLQSKPEKAVNHG
jgi:hypothetical protein